MHAQWSNERGQMGIQMLYTGEDIVFREMYSPDAVHIWQDPLIICVREVEHYNTCCLFWAAFSFDHQPI